MDQPEIVIVREPIAVPDAKFYFTNLGADIARCVSAAQSGETEQYDDSLDREYQTLDLLSQAHRPEAFEEGLLMVRALEEARTANTLPAFRRQLNDLIEGFLPA